MRTKEEILEASCKKDLDTTATLGDSIYRAMEQYRLEFAIEILETLEERIYLRHDQSRVLNNTITDLQNQLNQIK